MSALKLRHLRATVGVIALAVALGFFASPASAATHVSPQAAPAKYCVTVVQKQRPNSSAAVIVSQTCSANPAAKQLSVDATETLLVTFWQNGGYGGFSDSVYGKDGGCDTSGYSMSDLTGVELDVAGISSYKLFNNCGVAQLNDEPYFEGTFSPLLYGNQSQVPGAFNDNVWSMHVYSY